MSRVLRRALALLASVPFLVAACGGALELGPAAGSGDGSGAGSSSSAGSGSGSGSAGSGSAGGGATGTTDAVAPQATLVLIHGMGGFTNILGVDYFFEVPGAWRALGARVLVPPVTPLASIEQRAGELKKQLDAVPGRLILVAHSQGGLDARYLVSKLGYADRTRALVTIATPHHGSQVADVALGLTPGPAIAAADVLLHQLGWSLDGAREVTVKYVEGTFNPSVPDAPGVTYWSWSGLATPAAQGRGAGWLHAPLLASWGLLDVLGEKSDGVVPEASAHWGAFQGMMPADHLGEVGQPIGETPVFDHRAFYRALLQKFHDQGW